MQRFKHSQRIPFIMAALIIIVTLSTLPPNQPPVAEAAIPSTVFNDWISGFELYQQGIFWWHTFGRTNGCPGGEFPNEASIKLRGFVGTATIPLENARCPILQDLNSNVVRDSQYIYYFQNKQLVRKAVSASVQTPPAPLTQASNLSTLSSSESLAIDAAGRLYWTTWSGSVTTIWQMRADNSEPPAVFVSFNATYPVIGRMMAYSFRPTNLSPTVDGIAFRDNAGNLWRYNTTLATPTLLSSGVIDFWVRINQNAALGASSPVFYAAGNGLFRITNTGTSTKIYNASSSNASVEGVTTDDQNIYLTEAIYSDCPPGQFCSPEPTNRTLYRSPLDSANTGSWELFVEQGGGLNLRSDGKYVYMSTGTSLRRVPTGAPAVQIAIKADGLEVVQTIQSLIMDIPLIADKPTYARGYAHVLVNTSSNSVLRPTALLYGKLFGQDLPGSPLSPINNPYIDTTSSLGTLRESTERSFLFELPNSWVQDEITSSAPSLLNLRMVVNPYGGIPETQPNFLADNSVSLFQSAQIYHKGRPCLITVPIWVKGEPFPGGLWPVYERARALMPIEDFRIYDYYNVSGQTVAYLSDGDQPYDDLTSDDTGILWKLFWIFVSTDPPPSCGDQTFVLGLLPQNVEWHSDDGEGTVSGVTRRNWRALLVRMSTSHGELPWETARGGFTLAHELGHDYGRRHINCGDFPDDQKSFDSNAPFDNCHLSDPLLNTMPTHFGFDPLTLSVIGPTMASDIMSYQKPKWSSVNYYNYLFNRTVGDNNPSMAADTRPQLAPQSTSMLMVGGSVAADQQSASFRHFYVLPQGAAQAAYRASLLETQSGDVVSYTLRLLSDTGAPLSESVVPVEANLHSEDSGRQFHSLVPYNPQTRRIQLLREGVVLAERVVSASAPTLSLSQPSIDTARQRLDLSWSADDPDGDVLQGALQYSADGTNWRTLLVDERASSASLALGALPGSTQARLRLLVSDGVNTTVAESAPFVVPQHAPVPQISGMTEGERQPFGQALRLSAIAYDAEEGNLDDDQLSWTLTGPTTVNATGNTLTLRNLPPGSYTVTVAATDQNGQRGTASSSFEVGPLAITDGAAPALDGSCDDAGYTSAALTSLPQPGRADVTARLTHAGGSLYACFSELPYGAVGPLLAGVRVDPNASGDPAAQADDIGFFVSDENIPLQTIGDGTGMPLTTAPRPGFSAAVVRGTNAWSAELRIAEGLVGGWSHAARLMVTAGAPSATSDDAAWPPVARYAQPASWAAASFGTPPAASNRAPQADAGRAGTYYPNAPLTITLDGTDSADPDGQALSYTWIQVDGPPVALSDSAAATPHFSIGPVRMPTPLRFRLTVSDGQLSSSPAEVELLVLPQKRLMGADYQVYVPLTMK